MSHRSKSKRYNDRRELGDVISRMAGFGYTCFWRSSSDLLPISGDCWRKGYERIRKASRLVCAQMRRARWQEQQDADEDAAMLARGETPPERPEPSPCAVERGCCAVMTAPATVDDEAAAARKRAPKLFCCTGCSLASLMIVLGVNVLRAANAIESRVKI